MSHEDDDGPKSRVSEQINWAIITLIISRALSGFDKNKKIRNLPDFNSTLFRAAGREVSMPRRIGARAIDYNGKTSPLLSKQFFHGLVGGDDRP